MRRPRPGPLDPTRIRRIEGSFGWVPHALIRRKITRMLSREELLLYFFLCAVSDAQGVSFYGEALLEEHLSLSPCSLDQARGGLMAKGLILWREGVYQVLPLPAPPVTPGGIHRLVRTVLEKIDARSGAAE